MNGFCSIPSEKHGANIKACNSESKFCRPVYFLDIGQRNRSNHKDKQYYLNLPCLIIVHANNVPKCLCVHLFLSLCKFCLFHRLAAYFRSIFCSAFSLKSCDIQTVPVPNYCKMSIYIKTRYSAIPKPSNPTSNSKRNHSP